MTRYDFLVDTDRTERWKTLSVWSQVVYRYGSVEELLASESGGGPAPPLPGPDEAPPTERAEDR